MSQEHEAVEPSAPAAFVTSERVAEPGGAFALASPGLPLDTEHVLALQKTAGNQAVCRFLARAPAPTATAAAAPAGALPVAFVREDGLNLRAKPDQKSHSLGTLKYGTRVHVLEGESRHAGWDKVAAPAGTGFAFAPQIHAPPANLIQQDPMLKMIRVTKGQTFWGLVREQYGIRGNEGTADLNVNHYINAIRAFNKDVAFEVKGHGVVDDIIPGRDASDTELKANYDLWIPSFGVATSMDVGSGTVTGEITRAVKKIEQKIEDFRTACHLAGKHIPAAIAQHAGEVSKGLLHGLIDFAIDAAKILAVSTAVGALIGALFGGVGAAPGAEIGFEIGLQILEYYGLALLIETILQQAASLAGRLGTFISQVWGANGDHKKLDVAGATLADALGIMVGAVLLALVAYATHKGAKALGNTKFAKTVGESELGRWLAERQRMETTQDTVKPKEGKTRKTKDPAAAGSKEGVDPTPESIRDGSVRFEDHPHFRADLDWLHERRFKLVDTSRDPHVVARKVVGTHGDFIRMEYELHVRKGMRYIDWRHEIGHVHQLLDPKRWVDGMPKPTEIKMEDGRNARDQTGVLTTKENAVLEYHNRLDEIVRLDALNATHDVMVEHLEGIDGTGGRTGWRHEYWKATRGGPKSKTYQWAKEHFPDIQTLEHQVAVIRAKVRQVGGHG